MFNVFKSLKLYHGDWGLGIGDWGMGIGMGQQIAMVENESPNPIEKQKP